MKAEPFFFDSNIFDDDQPLSEEEQAALPEFTKDEMSAAKAAAFEEGKKAGFKESQEGVISSIQKIVQKIENDISVLMTNEGKRHTLFEEETTLLTSVLFSKALPNMMKNHGKEELKKSITEALSMNMVPSKIDIEINESIIKELSSFIEEHASSLNKNVNIKADNSLTETSCKINWAGGGIICDRGMVTEKILDILNQALAERGISLHDEIENHGVKEALTSTEHEIDNSDDP